MIDTDKHTLLQRVALQTLSELVSGLCYPMEPYTKYPELLDVIMSFFKSDTPLYIKKEVGAWLLLFCWC